MNKRGGFTYVELVVFIAVLALLTILTVFGITQYQENNQKNQTTSKTSPKTTDQTTTTQTAPESTKLGAPMLSLVQDSATQITANWTPAAHSTTETTYTLTQATNSDFTTGVVTKKGITTNSATLTKLIAGKTYYFKVQAVSPTETSDSSNVETNIQTSNTSVDVSQTSTQTSNVGSSTNSSSNTIAAPSAFTITGSNDGKSLTAKATAATCATGTTKYFSWKANDTPWVEGTQYETATYALSYGQGVTLKASVRCQKDDTKSTSTDSNNTVQYTRPGMNLKLTAGADNCDGNYCGRVMTATWDNICGTTVPLIKAKQLATLSDWKATSASSDSIKWKGATSPGVQVTYYLVDLGCTSAASSINVISAYKCTGCR